MPGECVWVGLTVSASCLQGKILWIYLYIPSGVPNSSHDAVHSFAPSFKNDLSGVY